MKFIASLLVLLWQAVSSLDTKFTANLPTGMNLISGDWLSIPLDDYVNVKGAKFTGTTTAGALAADAIVPKVVVSSNSVRLQPQSSPFSPSTDCIHMVRVNTTHVVLLCQSKTLYRVPINDKLELLNNPMYLNGKVDLSTDANCVCTDMVMIPSTSNIITACYIKSTTAGTTNLVLYQTDASAYWPMGVSGETATPNTTYHNTFTATQVTIPNQNSFPRLEIYAFNNMANIIYVMGIWNAVPFTGTTTTADTSTFWKCSGTYMAGSFTPQCSSHNVATIYGITSNFPGSVRGLKFLNNDIGTDYGFMVMFADSLTANVKKIGVGVVALDATNSYQPKNKVANSIFNSVYYADITGLAPGSDGNSMLAFVFAGSPLSSANINHFMVVDRLNLVYVSLGVGAVNGFNQITDAQMNTTWSTPFECNQGTRSPVFAFRTIYSGTVMSNLDSRVAVDYRYTTINDLGSFSGLAISFNYTKYGCWPSNGNTHSSIQFKSFNQIVSFSSTDMYYGTLNQDTLLRMKVTNPNSGIVSNTINLNAMTEGSQTTAATASFTYSVASKSEDFNMLNLTSNNMRAYPNTKFWLPIAASSFICNAANYSVDKVASTNVIIGHVQRSMLIGDVLDQSANPTNTFRRVISLDREWSLAIYTSSGQNGEGFALVKTQYDTGVAYFSSPAFAAKIEYSNNAIKSIIKGFKWSNAFCVLALGAAGSSNSLYLACYKLESKSATESYSSVLPSNWFALTTDGSEIVSVQPLVTDNTLDILGVYLDTSGSTALGYWSATVSMSTAGGITSYTYSTTNLNTRKSVTFTNMDDGLLTNYKPLDILPEYWGDEENTNLVSIRMYKPMSPPMVVRFNLMATGSAATLHRVRAMRMDNADLIYCPMRDDLVFYSPKTRQIFAQRWDKLNVISKSQSRFYFPITDYGVLSVVQFDCVSNRGYFQILAKATVSGTRSNVLITYRGGESSNGGRRVHSVVQVANDAAFISSSSDKDFIYTWATSPAPTAANKYIVQTSIRGPTFYVDTAQKVDKFEITLNQTSKKLADTGNTSLYTIFITQPVLTATVKPKNAFDLSVNNNIALDDNCDISGPVIDIQKVGDDAGPPNGPLITLTPRISGRNSYKIGNVANPPTKVMVEGVFQVLVYGKDMVVQVQGDPIMVRAGANNQVNTIVSDISSAMDALLINSTMDGMAVAIVKTTSAGSYYYSLYQLNFSNNAYTSVTSSNVFMSSTNFDTMQATWVKDYGVVLALSSNINFVSNYIKLVGFKYDTTSKLFTKEKEAIVHLSPSRELGTFTLVSYYDASTPSSIVRRATIIGRYVNFPGFTIAHWDLMSNVTSMVSSNAVVRVSDTTTDNVIVNFNYIRCWNRPDKDRTCSCLVDALGISKYFVDITFKVPPMDNSEPLDSVVKVFEFIVPPKYGLVKADRAANYFGLLLERTEPFPAAVQSIIKYDDCQRIIATYKPTTNQVSYVYSTVLCSSFGVYNEVNMDFAMESFSGTSAGEYIFYSNTLDSNKLMKYDFIGSAMVKVNMAIPDPSAILLKFIGLSGPNDPNVPAVKLGDLNKGAPPAPSSSTWWIWLLVILLIVGLAVGGYFAWVWYQNQASSSSSMSSSSSYKKPEEAKPDMNSSTDLEDTRL